VNPDSEMRMDGYSILLILQMFMMRLRFGVIALGVRLMVSLSSATDGELLLDDLSGETSRIFGMY
jgi:hypothetical protein